MKVLSSALLADLNATANAGLFFFAVLLAGAPAAYADVQEPVAGYVPMGIHVEGWTQTNQQSLPTLKVSVMNVDGQVGAFLETTTILGNDVTVQVCHLDLLGVFSVLDSVHLQVLLAEWTQDGATFTLGLNLGLGDSLPRHVVTRTEYPGTPDQFRRASIL